MRRILLRITLVLAGTFLIQQAAFAQTNIPLLGFTHGVGARAIGMGGAFVGIADDYSATFWNPAGLGQIRRMELSGSFNTLSYENNTTYFNNPLSDETNFSNLNSLGFAFPVPTYRGSLVLALGYNRVANYSSNFVIEGFNSSPGDSVQQAGSQLDRGGLRQWTFAGSVQMSKQLYFGGSINVYTGNYDYSWLLNEDDNLNIYEEDTWLVEDLIDTKITGFGLTLAALYSLNNQFRFGATVETPVTYKGEEEWSSFEEVNYDDNTFFDTTAAGVFEYKIRKPVTVSLGASYSVPLLTLSGGVTFTDWSQLEYTEPSELNSENSSLLRNLEATASYRLGAELVIPGTNARIRGGYRVEPSPFKNNTQRLENVNFITQYSDKKFYSGGFGILIDRQFTLDVGVVHGTWESQEPGGPDEEVKTLNYFVSAAFRF
jgi:long-subunit fatty acid transport protein